MELIQRISKEIHLYSIIVPSHKLAKTMQSLNIDRAENHKRDSWLSYKVDVVGHSVVKGLLKK